MAVTGVQFVAGKKKKKKKRNDMAYRRRQGITRASTFKEEIYQPPTGNKSNDNNKTSLPAFSFSQSFSASSSASESLAAQAIRASAAHRESSLSSAYVGAGADSAFASDHQRSKVPSFFLFLLLYQWIKTNTFLWILILIRIHTHNK